MAMRVLLPSSAPLLTITLCFLQPLSQNHPSGIQPHTQLHVPEGLSLAATSLLTELLQYNPKQRLGSGGDGMAKLKSHSFFSTVLWNKLVG